MRQIKFRGLNQNGEWIYGSYVTDYKDFHAIMTQHPFDDERMLQTPVHKETVGQFTGTHDKNGVELYEGDTAKWGDLVMHVKYSIEDGAFTLESKTGGAMATEDYMLNFEIIGNIHQSGETK